MRSHFYRYIDRAIKVAHVAGISSPRTPSLPRVRAIEVHGERFFCAEIINRDN